MSSLYSNPSTGCTFSYIFLHFLAFSCIFLYFLIFSYIFLHFPPFSSAITPPVSFSRKIPPKPQNIRNGTIPIPLPLISQKGLASPFPFSRSLVSRSKTNKFPSPLSDSNLLFNNFIFRPLPPFSPSIHRLYSRRLLPSTIIQSTF